MSTIRDRSHRAPQGGRSAGQQGGRSVAPQGGRSVVVVGAGGNIGSHLIGHLARMPATGIARITLIDQDRYEAGNLAAQDIRAADVGKPKALVQARRLRAISADLEVEAVAAPVESLPAGMLRADVILACLDSRRARQYVNQIAFRLGVPLIDAGVDGSALLARVDTYAAGGEGACAECQWSQRDYDLLEQDYPCLEDAAQRQEGAALAVDNTLPQGDESLATRSALPNPRGAAPYQDASASPADDPVLQAVDSTPPPSGAGFPTGAPSSLGALAAALQALECQRLLAGDPSVVSACRQVLLDARHHTVFVTALRNNPRCRMPDHAPWRVDRIDRSPADLSLEEAFRFGAEAPGDGAPGLCVAGRSFVTKDVCSRCGHERAALRLWASLRGKSNRCRHCGATLSVRGFDLVERIDRSLLSARVLSRSLARLGLRAGDIFTLERAHGEERHFLLSGEEKAGQRRSSRPARADAGADAQREGADSESGGASAGERATEEGRQAVDQTPARIRREDLPQGRGAGRRRRRAGAQTNGHDGGLTQ